MFIVIVLSIIVQLEIRFKNRIIVGRHMKEWIKYLLITLIFGGISFVLGPILWTSAPELIPSPAQLPYFMLLSAVEALFFGFGIAFLLFGWPIMKKISNPANKTTAIAFIALCWLAISWWSHDNLHRHNGMDLTGLLFIEYGFHLTLIIATLILMIYFMQEYKLSKTV